MKIRRPILMLLALLSYLGLSQEQEEDLSEQKKLQMLHLRQLLKCNDRDFEPRKYLHSNFWVLENYVRAEHGQLHCHESITYTTQADYRYLDNLVPLLERWKAPISLALYAPGEDFTMTLKSIKWLRQCEPKRDLVKRLVSFHIYFNELHMPIAVPKAEHALDRWIDCDQPAPFLDVQSADMYRYKHGLLYPVNVGRNVARDAALSHFVLASDIELYPSPNLVPRFLDFIEKQAPRPRSDPPRVFPLHIFEVEPNVLVPNSKRELQALLRSGDAVPFHQRLCAECHDGPRLPEWIKANATDDSLHVFFVGKRNRGEARWEPIYIGTKAEPDYDERFSWEGMNDKMTQGYALCALDYEFHILDNAFLVHKPGIKETLDDKKREDLASRTYYALRRHIFRDLRLRYGTRFGCYV